ncbi:hypothetical protein CB1_000940006 [Camelus ferus]|nr:hypothetical protein CB1_000940006 [Camelus ferus]
MEQRTNVALQIPSSSSVKNTIYFVQSVNSCHSCACGNSSSWDKADEDDIKLVNIPVTTPENLYLMGMELFEEALRRWEQALTFRNRQAEDEACGSIKLGAGDAIAEESVDDIISTEFIHKLEALLQRAYRLQEEFEATLGAADPNSLANDIDKDTDITMKGNVDDFGLRDTLSVASTDSFASAAENPKKFEDVFDEMIYFLEQTDHWDSTEMELAARGVKNLNFYDVVLDFILMDSFEDLENPPTSIQNVVNNRWLNSSFKETNQVLFFLKDIFDFEKVRYSSIETLTEDLMHLLIRRTELLMAYLGADALRHTSSCLSTHGHVMSSGLLEAKVQ